ncbi:hypothetical protein PFISCL1PPCAC_28955, partial [Pristionchus fissidentatus]
MLLVEEILSHAGAHSLEVGHDFGHFVDRFHLLVEVFVLQEGSHVRVVVLVSDSMQLEQRLVVVLFESEHGLESLESTSPLVLLGLLNVVEDDSASSEGLELHQSDCVFSLLIRALSHELGDIREGDVVSVEVRRHREVHIRGIQLDVHLLVNSSLGLGGVVLSAERFGGHG